MGDWSVQGRTLGSPSLPGPQPVVGATEPSAVALSWK
jgi:hypothetical protein